MMTGIEKTLLMMVGLPRSGKSTWAQYHHYPIVNPDSIRLVLTGQRVVQQAEPMVWTMARYMVEALFLAGHHTVILDATNINKKYRDQWRSPNWNIRMKIIPTSPDVCKQRAIATGQDDLLPVIDRMYAELMTPENVEDLKYGVPYSA